MTKFRSTMYAIAFALSFAGALIVDGVPLVAIGMIAAAGISIRLAERW